MKVLAIDPGYGKLGIAVLEKKAGDKEKLIFSECFSPQKKLSEEEKALAVGREIRKFIKKYKPGFLALEKLFFNKNQKTAMAVSETRGVIIYEAMRSGLEIHQYTPLQIKVAVTSYGRSEKKEVENMVRRIMGMKDNKLRTDDEYDAIAVGITFFAHFRP